MSKSKSASSLSSVPWRLLPYVVAQVMKAKQGDYSKPSQCTCITDLAERAYRTPQEVDEFVTQLQIQGCLLSTFSIDARGKVQKFILPKSWVEVPKTKFYRELSPAEIARKLFGSCVLHSVASKHRTQLGKVPYYPKDKLLRPRKYGLVDFEFRKPKPVKSEET